jgi:general secretion pathway protein J
MNENADCELRTAEWTGQSGSNLFFTPHSELRTPNSEGFTLIEVLLALAILALVVTIVYMAFSTTSVNVERAEAARDETDLARALISRLSSDIANAYCRTSQSATTFFFGKKEEAEEEGKRYRRDSLALTTLTNWRRPDTKESELWEVGYFFREKPDGSGSVLMRREKRELNKDVPPLEGGMEYELTGRVRELRLRYLVNKKWQDDYGGSRCSGLPTAVEIALTLEDEKFYVTQVMVDRSATN